MKKFSLYYFVCYLACRYGCHGRHRSPGGACRVVFRIVLSGAHPHDLIGAQVSIGPEARYVYGDDYHHRRVCQIAFFSISGGK